MKVKILFLLAFFQALNSFAQDEKSAKIIHTEGIILFTYGPNKEVKNFFCPYKTAFLFLDSLAEEHFFYPQTNINYDMIRQNPEIEKATGSRFDYVVPTDLIYENCMKNPNNQSYSKAQCAKMIKQFKETKVYHESLYFPLKGYRKFAFKSNSIFQNPSDSAKLFIAIKFKGSIIQYQNLDFKHYEAIEISLEEPIGKVANDFGKCYPTSPGSSFIALKKIELLSKITEAEAKKLGLVKSDLEEIPIFTH